jgi:hypothetical protein
MNDPLESEFRRRLTELGERINARVTELERQGVLHGAERKAAADWKLLHTRYANSAASGGKSLGEIAADIQVLRLTFERWLARVDKAADKAS